MKKIKAIACSIFKNEIEYLKKQGKISVDFKYLDSDLHMRPQELQKTVHDLAEPGKKQFLVYGDCYANILSDQRDRKIIKTKGMNCVEIFLGKEKYHKLRAEGVFFLLPEWTVRWEHIFKKDLGFSNQNTGAEFMNEMHSRFIYVDTGVIPVPEKILNEIKDYFKMQLEVITVSLDNLENTINNALHTEL